MSGSQRKYMGFVKDILNKNALSANKQKEQQQAEQFNRDLDTNISNVSPVTSETSFRRPIEDGRYNNSREYQDYNQWPKSSPKFGNNAFEMPKNPPSRMLTPPPPSIDWSNVVGRFSRDHSDDQPNRRDDNFQNKFGMDDQNHRHNFNKNALCTGTADKHDSSVGRHGGNVTSWQLENANEESRRSEGYEGYSDSHNFGYPEQKGGYWKSESAFQNKDQSDFEGTQGFCRNEIDFDDNENSDDETIHQNYKEIIGSSNPNNREFKSAEGFWGLETANDNSTDIDWKALARGDIRKNNISTDTFFDNSKELNMYRADDMNCGVTTRSNLHTNTFEENNFEEERVEVRIANNAKIQCVSMTTKQYERYKKALSLGFPISEAFDYSEKGLKTIGLIPNNLKENPLGLHQMEHIENTIINYATKCSVNTNLMSCYPQKGWLIMLCNNGIVDLLQSHLPVIRNLCKLNINLVTEGERIFPRGHSVHGYFPRSINYSTFKVLELIQAQNDLTTTLWRSVGRSVEEGLVLNITFEVDDNSWSKLQELNGSIFYRFGRITLTLEESDSNENKNRISQLSTTMPYTGNSEEISKSNVYNKPTVAQTNTPQHIQNSTLMNHDKLERDIATNMKLLQHARTLEETVTSEHTNSNMHNMPAIAQRSIPQHIPNAKLMKLDQLKKEIATNMRLLEHKRMLEQHVTKDTTAYTGYSKETSKLNMYNKPAITQTNTPQHIQNATLMQLEMLKKGIANNMKLLEHSRTLEETVASGHKNSNMHNKPVKARTNTPLHIQNATLMQLDMLKQEIATNMKLQELKRTLEGNSTSEHKNKMHLSGDTRNPREFSNPSVYKQPGIALANPQNTNFNQSKRKNATNMLVHNKNTFRGLQFSNTTSGKSHR